MIQGKIGEQELARYPKLLTEANQRMSEPWFLVDEHTHERFKFKATLSADILSSFRGRRYAAAIKHGCRHRKGSHSVFS